MTHPFYKKQRLPRRLKNVTRGLSPCVLENCWSDEIFCVVDTIKELVTFDGKEWNEVEHDHL